MKKIIKHYKTILDCEQFRVVGSTALRFLGLDVKEGDLDIVLVNPKDSTLELLKKLQEASPAKTSPGSSTAVQYIFMYEGVKIDIFIDSTVLKDCPKIDCDGVLVDLNPVRETVAAKKQIGRAKDWLQLSKLASGIMTNKELLDHINKY